MLTKKRWLPSSPLTYWVGTGGVIVGVAAGVLAGAKPLYLGLALGTVIGLVYFFVSFEQAVLGLLILRSSLDIFSAQQIPAVFAVGVDILTLLYVTVLLLTGQTVRTDRFWWFFAGWVMLQGLWVILLPLGGLGLDTSFLPISVREWVRLFTWVMVYLLVMQLKNRLHPEKIVSVLFISLIAPVIAALMQIFLPPSLLPSILIVSGSEQSTAVTEISRINGTLGLSNTFATFLLLFISLTWWKLNQAQRRWPWLLLLGLLTFLLVGTKTLFSLPMLGVLVLVLITPKLKLLNLVGGVLLLVVVLALFASSEFGQERLSSLFNTPLLNSDIDVSRAILLSQGDNNSFNWRIAQWNFLLQAWGQSPIFGNGLSTSSYLTPLRNMAHNDYIRPLAEQGVVGLAAFIVFLGAQATHLVRLLRCGPCGGAQRDLCLVLLALLLATLVGMCTENIWSHTTFYFYWWTLLAVAGWNWNKAETSESPLTFSHPLKTLPWSRAAS